MQHLAGGAKSEERLPGFTGTGVGVEPLVAVLTEALPTSEVENLSFLAQNGMPPATRLTRLGDFSAALLDIGAPPTTRPRPGSAKAGRTGR